MAKNKFMFYVSWMKNIDMMDETELRRFLKNLCNHAQDKPLDLPTKTEQMVWNGVVELLDYNEDKRQQTIKRRSEAGKKGGAPAGNTNAQKKTDVVEEQTNQANQANQAKQTEEGRTMKDEGMKEERRTMNEERKKDEGRMVDSKKDEGNRLMVIMKQVIDEGLINKEDVLNWKIKDTRNLLNEILYDYGNWETDLLKYGVDGFLNKVKSKTKIPIDHLLVSTIKAHSIL